MTQVVIAKHQAQPTPTLLPQIPAASVAVKNAAKTYEVIPLFNRHLQKTM